MLPSGYNTLLQRVKLQVESPLDTHKQVGLVVFINVVDKTAREEDGNTTIFQVSISSQYDLSCVKRFKKSLVSFLP